jgi:putative iron-only hydrogenase system regulator
MTEVQKRLGFVGIIIDDREKCSGIVNEILSQFGNLILARTGLPNAKGNTSVITLVVDATTDELGMLTGKLGAIQGVSVKSGLSKTKNSDINISN